MIYFLAIFFIGAFILSFSWDNRSVLNPIFLILIVFFGYIALAEFFYTKNNHLVYNVLFLIPIFIFLSGIFLIYNGFVLMKKEGRSKSNFLSFFTGIAILNFFALFFYRMSSYSDFSYDNAILNFSILTIFYTYLIFGFAFAGFMLYSWLYLIIPKQKKYDFIIIHGAGLLNGKMVTPLLKKRIDTAINAYYRLQPSNVKIIASGGQGEDEDISEAQAITNYIFDNTTIPKEDVLLEDKSTTTHENLLFSKQLGETMIDKPRFLFVTNNYHVYRTSLYAKQIGLKGDGLGCRTAAYYIPSAFIREFIASCIRIKWLFIILYLVYFLLIFISYIGINW